MNPDAQWNELVEYGWIAKWIQVRGRPMDLRKDAFDLNRTPRSKGTDGGRTKEVG